MRFEFHPTTNMKKNHKWAAAIPAVRVGYLVFPGGFETASFAASPDVPARISRDWVYNVGLFSISKACFDRATPAYGFASRQFSAMPTSTVSGTSSVAACSMRSRTTSAAASASSCGALEQQLVVDGQDHARREPALRQARRGDRSSPSSGCRPPCPGSACSPSRARPARASGSCGSSGSAPAAAARTSSAPRPSCAPLRACDR